MARKKTAQKKNVPGWVWLTTGLLVGLFVAFLVYLRDHYPVMPPAGSTNSPAAAPAERAPAPPEPQDAIPPVPKTRYDFYTILPEMEVAIPEDELAGDSGQGVPRIRKPGTYVLQAGAFHKYEEADRMKASLALLGVEASIQTVTIDGKETWHRVRIGPYSELGKLNRIRARLQQNDIEVILLKIKT